MEIKVNDYVRTRQGYIAKIEKETNDSYWCDDTVEYIYEPSPFIFKDKANEIIVKSSPNIIDLIEVGDYVNENKIINISDDHCGRKVLVWGFDNDDFQCAFAIYEEDIETIVTKEQFGQMEYKID